MLCGAQVNIGRVDVVEVSGSSITVASRKNLQLDRYEAAAAAAACGSSGGSSGGCGSRVLWRLDHDEAASIGMHQRAAVLSLAAASNGNHVQRLQELIVDLAAPRLQGNAASTQQQQQGDSRRARSSTPPAAAPTAGLDSGGNASRRAKSAPPAVEAAGGDLQELPAVASSEPFGAAARLAAASGEAYLSSQGSHLNSNQVAVLRRVMAMQDYCLVLGMPGKMAGGGRLGLMVCLRLRSKPDNAVQSAVLRFRQHLMS
jgi:hypothetical protein